MMNKNTLNAAFLTTNIVVFSLMLINKNTWIGLQNFAYYYGGSDVIKPIARFMENMPFVVTFPFKGATLVFIFTSLFILAVIFILSLKRKTLSANTAVFYSATGIFFVYIIINVLVLMAYFH